MIIALLVAFVAGLVAGMLLRSDIERGYIGRRLAERRAAREQDDMAVLTWLEENGTSDIDVLIGQVRIGAGRVRGALDRLEARGIIQSGYPSLESPNKLAYWRLWNPLEEEVRDA